MAGDTSDGGRVDSNPFSWRDRLRSRTDTAISTGAVWWVILWLAVVMMGFLVATAAIIGALGLDDGSGRELGYVEGFWQALLRALDPGTMAGDSSWALRLTSLVITLTGVLLVSTLIGVTATGISSRLAEIRRGKVPMTEYGHTLVLGWSSKIKTLLTELALAHGDDKGFTVVILSTHDKSEMDEQISSWLRDGPKIRVLTRTGSPHTASDLRIVNPTLARSIIILRNGLVDGDARVVKASLALLHDLRVPPDVPIVAEMGSGDAAHALRGVVDGRIRVIEPGDLIARLIAQACRHPGVDQVLSELFSYEGSELYVRSVPEVARMPFADAAMSFESCIPIGLITGEGETIVRPDNDRVIDDGDRLILIAEDERHISFTGRLDVVAAAPDLASPHVERAPERSVMFGFNEFAPLVLSELDDYVPPDSSLVLLVDAALGIEVDAHLPSGLANLQVKHEPGPMTPGVVAEVLRRVEPDYVIVLCYRSELSAADADARTLVTFLEAGQVITSEGIGANVVAELLDPSDANLVPSHWSDEFIITEHLSSLFITQISEDPSLGPVFDDLLDADGSEIYCKPIEWYAHIGNEESFASLSRSALRRNEIAVGYRSARDQADLGRDIVVNPGQARRFVPTAGDALVVLADDDQ